jgi:NAD(P)-dependent dehydrogenase (short-subunit alcohol dehydrogenase family)
MAIRFGDRVAIVTGAGGGLGRAHALGLAALGAKVVVNDLAGDGGVSSAAQRVVDEIVAAGGNAIAHSANVVDEGQVDDMVRKTLDQWGRIDILVNNAGILRDRSFLKLEIADFKQIFDVHVFGAIHCTRAVWPVMREQRYGRVVFTTSSSGIYGNFGQSNYGAAKAALVGLTNTLHLEGEKYDIRVNALAPIAATRMTDGLLQEQEWQLLPPEDVTPGLLFLVSDQAPSRTVLCAGGGCFARAAILETEGIYLSPEVRNADEIARRFVEVCNVDGAVSIGSVFEQSRKFAQRILAEQSAPKAVGV